MAFEVLQLIENNLLRNFKEETFKSFKFSLGRKQCQVLFIRIACQHYLLPSFLSSFSTCFVKRAETTSGLKNFTFQSHDSSDLYRMSL